MTTIKNRLNKKANLLTNLANSTALMTSATGQALARRTKEKRICSCKTCYKKCCEI